MTDLVAHGYFTLTDPEVGSWKVLSCEPYSSAFCAIRPTCERRGGRGGEGRSSPPEHSKRVLHQKDRHRQAGEGERQQVIETRLGAAEMRG